MRQPPASIDREPQPAGRRAMHWGPGPVFVYECLAIARRWQIYVARSFTLAALLVAMTTIAPSGRGAMAVPAGGALASHYAKLGESYFYALIGVELALVMLAAPASTAGAIC